MTVITLARQVGSGGQVVASSLSQKHGLRVVGRKELQARAASEGLFLPASFARFASEEVSDPRLNHYLSYSEVEFDFALSGATHKTESHHDSGFLTDITAKSREILLTLQILIYELAAQDNVLFVGAGAQILLAAIPQVLRAKIIAPVETRVERMMTGYSLTEIEARAAVHGGDQEQIDYNRVVFDEDWNNPELWDIVINSESLTVDQIVELIASAPKSTTQVDEVSTQLTRAAAINRALLDAPAAGNSTAYAVPTQEGIVIRGDVPNDDVRRELVEIVTTVAAGSQIVDKLEFQSML
jgi:cytidylate kinase